MGTYAVPMPSRNVTDWTDQQLAILRPLYPKWDLWAVRYATMRQTAWCARPKGTPVATINVDSPEELVAAITEHESRL
jgi:hypothetical protein